MNKHDAIAHANSYRQEKKKLNTIHIIYFDIIKKGHTRYNTYIESKLVQEPDLD